MRPGPSPRASRIPRPLRALLSPFQQFVRSESTGGIVLIGAAVAALVWANSPWSKAYHDLLHVEAGIRWASWSIGLSLHHWVNDGLMAVFFFFVGLELKRELLVGELSEPRKAILPAVAAVGGMVAPACFYAALATGDATPGWGIPMATDIAFALGILSLLGKRVPPALKVFLAALAIVDDLGAVLVIAVFYSDGISFPHLGSAALVIAAGWIYGRIDGSRTLVWILLGAATWYLFLSSGIHATVAGVLLASTVPMRRRVSVTDLKGALSDSLADGSFEEHESGLERVGGLVDVAQSPLHRLEHALQPWVAYIIMPLFALFNAGLDLSAFSSGIGTVTSGAFVGLLVGKPTGITLASWVAVRTGLSSLPGGVGWRSILGAGLLGGIGFTMSLFIAALAFPAGSLLEGAKLGILAASVVAAIAGLAVLATARRPLGQA